jgi:hypothetical protein
MVRSSQTVAGVGVGDCRGDHGAAGSDKNDVKHGEISDPMGGGIDGRYI